MKEVEVTRHGATSRTIEYLSRALRCPVCHTRFVVEVPVGVEPVSLETDFRPIFEGPDPVAADIVACPGCRYAGYAIAFEGGEDEEGEEIDRPGVPPPLNPLAVPSEEDLDALRRWIHRGELVRDLELGEREPHAAERYLLAARCYDYLVDSDPLGLADLYLRGAWSARAIGERGMEASLALDAVEEFGIAVDEGMVATEDEGRVLYLSGELARRAGEFALAMDLFGQVEAHLDWDEEDDLRLHRLTRRMESLASIQSAVPATMPTDEELDAAVGADEWSFGGSDEDDDET